MSERSRASAVKSVIEYAGKKLLPESYLQFGLQAFSSRDKKVRILLEERKLPEEGWDDLSIEMFLNQLAVMDSNNFMSKASVGEREARIYSPLVEKRHYRLCHGMGRSGDLSEVQPKAIGSSLMSTLVNSLVLDLCRLIISKDVKDAFLCPTATGMSLTLILLALKKEKPKAKFVIWPRIDQKSCFKCITTAGLDPLVVEGRVVGDEIVSNVEEIEEVIKVYGVENILCLLTTTSCFAPRAPDSLDSISKLSKSHNLAHIVNNAYGLQSGSCAYNIEQGAKVGRLDIFVQSTDKNLMVPVGGTIIAGFNKELLEKVRQTYPGRASSSQSLDVLITLLSMGSITYTDLMHKRKENYNYLKKSLESLGDELGESVLAVPHNKISLGFTLSGLSDGENETLLGSMLYKRNICGARVVSSKEVKVIEGHQFIGWGSHCNTYGQAYVTAAATLGMEKDDTDMFISRLRHCYKKLKED